MFESLINQFDTMSLGEELYTFCFTAFVVGGATCCLWRSYDPAPAQPALAPAPKIPKRIKQKSAPATRRPPATRRSVEPRLRAMPPQQPARRSAA